MNDILRRQTKTVKVGNVSIGSKHRISVQSMLNVPSNDVKENIKQALDLQECGCEIIRVSVPDKEAVNLVYKLKENLQIPVVADIHFDYKLAIESAIAGADKIRINPGNIGSEERVKAVVDECKKRSLPIRIGVNSGSLEQDILKKYKAATAQALVESAMCHISLLEKFDFKDIIVSIKSSNVKTMVDSYRLIAEKCDYPLHLGVTEAGTKQIGMIKSSVGIGSLLLDGIGDTIRVSLTAEPKEEIKVARQLLSSLGLQENSVEIISCPTCGRTKINLIKLANEVEDKLSNVKKNLKVAVMGCAVNGPGEAREADIGIAGGNKEGLIFKKGKIIKKVKEEYLVQELMEEIEKL